MIRRSSPHSVNLGLKVRGIRIRTRRAIALAAAVLLAACGGGGGDAGITGPAQPPKIDPYVAAAGSYALTSVNGSVALPGSVFYTTPAPGGRLDISSGSMVLRADKSFTETFNFTNIPVTGASTIDADVTTGTFVLTSGSIVFTINDPTSGLHSWSGTLDAGGTISYNDQGFLAVYKK